MKRYEMTPALRTGNEMIDMEHERIFEEVNALLEACQTGHAREHLGEMADFLADYVAVHFADRKICRQNSSIRITPAIKNFMNGISVN